MLQELGMQVIFLTAILLLWDKREFCKAIRLVLQDVCIF
jgi:hypothetical protein